MKFKLFHRAKKAGELSHLASPRNGDKNNPPAHIDINLFIGASFKQEIY